MKVTLIDGSHRDRPRLDITATEIISDRTGVLVLGARPVFQTPRPNGLGATSIENLRHDLDHTDELRLSHDWIVKVSN